MKLRQEHWDAVNKVGEEWVYAQRQLSSAAPNTPNYKRLQAYAENMEQQARNTIIEKIMQDLPKSRYDRDNDRLDYAVSILETLILERLPKFDGHGGNLSQYTNMCIGFLMKDHPYSGISDLGEGKHKIAKKYSASNEDDGTGSKDTGNGYIKFVSLDEQISNEDGDAASGKNLLPDNKIPDMDAELLAEETFFALIANILNMKCGGTSQKHYNSMLFTDTIVNYIHNYDGAKRAARHEQELFKAMTIPFLDFFMENPCRTILEIKICPTAPYSHLVDDEPDTPCPLPLEAKVFLSYLERIENHPISPAAWSQNKKKYQEFMKECFNS